MLLLVESFHMLNYIDIKFSSFVLQSFAQKKHEAIKKVVLENRTFSLGAALSTTQAYNARGCKTYPSVFGSVNEIPVNRKLVLFDI